MKEKIIDWIIAVVGVFVFIPMALVVVIISMILDLIVLIFVEDGEK